MSTALERKSKQLWRILRIYFLWKKEKYEFYAAAAVPCWTFGEEIFSKAGLYTGFVLWEISGCEFFEKCLGKGLLLSAIGDRIACTGGKTVSVKIFPAKGDKDYEIGKFKIKTCITDHNNSGLSNFVTVFSIDCGEDTGNFVFMHVGDSNYKPEQYTNLASHVNVLIPRYAPNALTENNILGSGAGQVEPDYVLLSHILELAHAGVDESRWSLELALERASKINCEQTYVPMWGEKMVWKNNKLN